MSSIYRPLSILSKLTPQRAYLNKSPGSWLATVMRGELSWAFQLYLPCLLLSFLMIWLVSWLERAFLLSWFIKQLSITINNLIVFSHVLWQWWALWWFGWARFGPRGAWCGYLSTNCSPPSTASSFSAMSSDNNKFFDDLVRHALGLEVCGRNWQSLLKPWMKDYLKSIKLWRRSKLFE